MAANSNTSVDIEGMKRAQGTFQTAVDESSSSYSNMEGQIEALGPAWTGQAATIFHGAMGKWLEDFRTVNQQLQRMLETLSQNTGVYANVHSDTEDKAQQVQQLISSGNLGGLPGFM
ncbi:WXG100 family type VII secretion target [Streptomyces tremellae]|uniref:ESAT-6-like protein n=1 Tax=Streptomyces tremellae TaxID=1124239 RepID=A0ABP7GBS9_9ACTN